MFCFQIVQWTPCTFLKVDKTAKLWLVLVLSQLAWRDSALFKNQHLSEMAENNVPQD